MRPLFWGPISIAVFTVSFVVGLPFTTVSLHHSTIGIVRCDGSWLAEWFGGGLSNSCLVSTCFQIRSKVVLPKKPRKKFEFMELLKRGLTENKWLQNKWLLPMAKLSVNNRLL